MMTGLESSELFFQQEGLVMLRQRFPDIMEKTAAGLVGEGSECFAFDDEISRDHDWDTGFCLWLDENEYRERGSLIQKAYEELLPSRRGQPLFLERSDSERRRGAFSVNGFYRRFINRNSPPVTQADWMKIPEEYLAVCTNGKVFTDPVGSFSAFRSQLLAFYPRDVQLKKIAARCVSLAQDGQYNFPRSLQRGDTLAANHALARFIQAACSLVFLIQKRYKPFYKWMYRGLLRLEEPGPKVAQLLQHLCTGSVGGIKERNRKRLDTIEETVHILIRELQQRELSSSNSSFLLKHALFIQDLVTDPCIQNLPLGSG